MWLGNGSGPAGLDADFGIILPDDTRETVEKRRTRGLWYPNYSQLLGPYLEKWNELRWGFPTWVPMMDIEWTGILSISRKERRSFGVEGRGESVIEIGPVRIDTADGPAVTGHLFEPGDYPVRIHYTGATEIASFKVYEILTGDRRRPAGRDFYPSVREKDARRFRRLLATLLLVFPTLTLLYLSIKNAARLPWRAFGPPLKHVAVVIVLLAAFFLRAHDRAGVPYHNETADEYYHAWAGWTLVHGETPRAWSWDPAYPDAEIKKWFGVDYRIVTPWLDQPPLYSMLVGAWGLVGELAGKGPVYRESVFYESPALPWLRFLPILLSCLSVLLVFHLGKWIYSWGVGLAAALLYATTPILVPLHRLIKGESLIVPLVLGVLALVLAHRKRPSRKKLLAIAVVCALAPLTKLTALFVPVLAALLLGSAGGVDRRRGVLYVAGGTAAGLVLLCGYAALVDWDLFWAVQRSQAAKPLGFLSTAQLMFDPKIILRPFGAPWVWWLWLAALPSMFTRGRWLALGIFLYLLVIAASGNRDFLFGWYVIPVYPLLAVAAAGELVGRSSLGPATYLFWVLYLGTSLEMMGELAGGEPIQPRVFLLLGGLILLLEIFRKARIARLRRPLAWTLLLVAAFINVGLIMQLRVLYG